MSYDALRRGRYSHFNQVYCVTTVTRGRRPLLSDITPARLLIRELRCLHDDGHVVSLAWVVMPDHLHPSNGPIHCCQSLARRFGSGYWQLPSLGYQRLLLYGMLLHLDDGA